MLRGWGGPNPPGRGALDVWNNPDFQRAIATNLPHASNAIPVEGLGVSGVVMVVPVRGPDDRPVGVVMVGISTEQLRNRYEGARLRPGQAIFLADRTGRLAFHTARPLLTQDEVERLADTQPMRRALAGIPSEQTAFVSPLLGDHERLAAFVPTYRYRWVVGVSVPRSLALAPVRTAFRSALTVFVGILLLSVMLANLLARRLVDPVHRLERAAQALGRGDLSRRVTIDTRDEPGRLGEAFNAMAGELGRLLRLREEFLQAAAHELKTPIATIKSSLYVLEPPQSRRARWALGIIARQINRMTNLADDLLTVTRLGAGRPELRRSRFDLGALAAEAARQAAASTDQQTIAVTSVEPLVVEADRELIETVLLRLLENAIQASPEKGTIELEAHREGPDAVVSVVHHGVGIPAERQPHVFEPFYEPVPSGQPGYVGVVSLRLHVSRRIVDAHGGRIWCTSRPGLTRFSFALPLVEGSAG